MNKSEILKIQSINKAFAGIKVINDVDLFLNKGEILGLIGENGAGKTTLMNLITGVISPDSGKIWFKGESFSPRNPLEAQQEGISFIHQELELFNNLSVMENMFIEKMPTKSGILNNLSLMKTVAKGAINRVGGGLKLNTLVEDLEVGKRQLLEIAKALSKNASLIIFDEPTTSLSSNEKNKLFEVIMDLRKEGTSIIYISHNLDEILRLSDHIMVMRDGKNIKTFINHDISTEMLVKMMVGREVNSIFPYYKKEHKGILLVARNITRGKHVKNVSLSLKGKEVVGIFGLLGSGRTELVRCIFGADEMDYGEIEINKKIIKKPTPITCINNGIAFLTENRSQEGLVLDETVDENLVVACLKRIVNRFGIINKKRQAELSQSMVEQLRIKTYNRSIQVARKLSGGNQQKIVLGKWILTTPTIFIMDEPTRGIDVGSKVEIYELINRLALNGSAILMVSSEMEELIGICDRIIVMHDGSVSGELERKEFDQERLLQLAFGIVE